MLNLAQVLESSARSVPDRDAVLFEGYRLSYSGLNSAANQVANLLRSRGIGRGDKVVLCCPNVPYFPIVYFGILKSGAAVVPLSVALSVREIGYHLADSGAKAFFCFDAAVGAGQPEPSARPLGERGFAAFRQVGTCDYFCLMPGGDASAEAAPAGADIFGAAVDGLPDTFDTEPTLPTDTAVILYGSGTSGRTPLGAELTHQNMVLNAMLVELEFGQRGHDVSLIALPLFHSFGQTVGMNLGLMRTATLVLLPYFDPVRAAQIMCDERITIFAGVPSMYWAILNSREVEAMDTTPIHDNLAYPICGGSGMPRPVLDEFARRFGVEILQGYGMSETSPVVTFNGEGALNKPGTIGRPLWGIEVKLIDDAWNEVSGNGPGEMAVRGHNVMKGYYKRPDATARVMRDGWLRTGDIAWRDADGYYTIIDRAIDVIRCSGEHIYPRDIEEVLMAHPEVSLAAVVGLPDDLLGERPVAYVIRRPGAAITEADLIAWARKNVTNGAWPRVVHFRETLPMTATGKILRRVLR